jgi:hypothetical protein
MENKITAVFPVMNRNDHVVQTIPSWLACEEIHEVVIVDWSSKIPLHLDDRCTNIINNDKVKIIRIEDEQYFLNPALALNIGIDMSKYDNIIKADIDHKLINKNFIKILIRNSDPGHFFCGTIPTKDCNCYWGFSYFHRQDYEKTGGFNENLRGWGGEDVDFYDRLEELNVERTVVLNIQDFIFHIDHGDNLRIANHEIKDMQKSNNNNGFISRTQKSFNKSKYNLLSIENNIISMKRCKPTATKSA